MHSFLKVWAARNGVATARALRELAEEVERLMLEPAAFGVPIIFYRKGVGEMGEITVKDTSSPLAATVAFLDAKGNATAPDTVPVWTSSDESVATVEASADGLSATVTVGSPGVTLITAAEEETVEDTGETSTVSAQGTITVQPGDAVTASVEFAQS